MYLPILPYVDMKHLTLSTSTLQMYTNADDALRSGIHKLSMKKLQTLCFAYKLQFSMHKLHWQ